MMRTVAAAQPSRHPEAGMVREVLPHAPGAWADASMSRVSDALPVNRYVDGCKPRCSMAEIETEMVALEGEIVRLPKGVVG